MLEHIFQINHDFTPWSIQHLVPVLFFVIGGWWLIHAARRWPTSLKWKIPFWLSLLLPASIIFWIIARLIRGEFDQTQDIPLHMCNLITFYVPFIFCRSKKRPRLFGIVYFWVLSGTLQAVITPGLEQAYPHFYYFRYWLIHCGLVVLVLYAVFVLDYYPVWRDIWNSLIAMNILFVVAYMVNIWLDSNYLYTMHRPLQPSLLDYFGPWPYYIIVSEFVALGFFVLYYFPFLRVNRRRQRH